MDEAKVLEAVSRALRGETSAFGEVIQAYQGQVFRICTSILKNTEDAEDAAQEVFCRAFRALPSFRLGRRFKPWLVSIALNTSKSYYRKKRTAFQKLSTVVPDELPSDSQVEEQGERSMMREKINEAIQRLPDRLRYPVMLYYLEELDIADIAEALNLSKENVKSRLHRARTALRKFLEKDATEG